MTIKEKVSRREGLLNALNETVIEASDYFRTANEHLFDGYQSARQVLSHLVFWHREYAQIVQAMVAGDEPELRSGTYEELNQQAASEFAALSLPELCDLLDAYQEELDTALRLLRSWNVILAIKRGGRRNAVAKRLRMIERHIHLHVTRLKRAERHGEAWVMAYYGGLQ